MCSAGVRGQMGAYLALFSWKKKEKEIEQRSMDFDNKGANLWQQLYDVKRWCFGMFLQQQKRLKKVEFYGGITY